MGVRWIAALATMLLYTAAPAHAEDAITIPAATPEEPVASALGRGERIDGDEAPGLVAFTFDDGPRVGTTDKVIDALLAYDVPATFFVVGHRLTGDQNEGARELLLRMQEEGFLVGNHTFSHAHLPSLEKKKLTFQIDHTTKVIEELLGEPIGLFRAPFGSFSKAASAHVARGGLTVVDWTIDSLDWRKPKPGKMRDAIIAGIVRENGGVVLLHDTKQLTANSIASILDALEAKNCERLAAGETPIVPVSLHYFLRDGGQPRAVPPEVEERTQRYRDELPSRCEARKAADR
jgi:peptidoglycan/xylan/chitin deacetylase (PgdA/CDA1 family)